MSGYLELEILSVILLLFLSFTTSHFLKKYKIVWFPESIAAMIFGFLFAVIWHYIKWLKDIQFSSDLFFFFLLPAIIFESGFSVHRQRFFKNLGTILTFAIIGTIIAAFAIAGLMYIFCSLRGGYVFDFLDYFIFGAIISATDPVATLSIFSKVQVHPNLYNLVFGESVLNDAAAITLFRTLVTFFDHEFSAKLVFSAIGKFILIFCGSFVIGILMGMLCSLIMKKSTISEDPPLEILLIIGIGYFAYFLCDVIYLSGIVSIFFVGISIRHYAYHCLSEKSKNSALWFFSAFKEGAETSVFCLLGFSIFHSERYDVFLISMGILSCILGRAFSIFPLSNILNLFRSSRSKITSKWQVILFNAGLRGAVAVGLSLSKEMKERSEWGMMITAIHITVIFSIFFHGILTSPLLKWANNNEEQNENIETIIEKKSRFHSWWSYIDNNYIIKYISNPREYSNNSSLNITELNELEKEDCSSDEEESEIDEGEESKIFVN